MVSIKRIYDPASRFDGKRILIDRLWPRGIKKDEAGIDEWIKDVAPSDALRKWFGHDPAKWSQFRGIYKKEIKDKSESIERIRSEANKGRVPRLYSAKDTEHNNAVVLKEIFERG